MYVYLCVYIYMPSASSRKRFRRSLFIRRCVSVGVMSERKDSEAVFCVWCPAANCRLVGARFGRWREDSFGRARCLTLRYSLPLLYVGWSTRRARTSLNVEYAERGKENTVFYSYICRLFCEHIQLEYVRIHAIYRVDQAEYGIHRRVVAPLEYVNLYSTRSRHTSDRRSRRRRTPVSDAPSAEVLNLAFTRYVHDMVTANIVWSIAYKRESGGKVVYCPIIAQ